jgi:hypothetical protein
LTSISSSEISYGVRRNAGGDPEIPEKPISSK